MSQIMITPPVAHKFARAKAQLKRDDTVRAMAAMLAGLEEYKPQSLPGKARFEVEVLIIECVQDLNRQPAIRKLLEELAHSASASIPYTPGQEAKLRGVLGLLYKALTESIEKAANDEKEGRQQRKVNLEQKGLAYLREGDSPRGKAALRLLAEEYGTEPGVLAQIGEWLLDAKLPFEAVEMLEQSMEAFPKEVKAYSLASRCYTELREFEKAEGVYLKVIKQFGKHPRTLLNLAKLYVVWNKKEEAFRTAQEAYNKDNSLTEAKEIAEKYA